MLCLKPTSHGLSQHRVDASNFDIAVITNITHEHLDQHGSFINYRNAKARLFKLLEVTVNKPQGNPCLSVLNRDDGAYDYLASIVPGPMISYGHDTSADFRAISVNLSADGIRFIAIGPNFQLPVYSPLVGEFNTSNCLAALAVSVSGLNISPQLAG
jgi:UDP-N-acetylmuramoyl-L-alanyl-D-glutamate--2,6-diaminopimelate ligase